MPGIIIGAGIGTFGAASKKASLDQVLLAALFGGAAGAAGNLAASAASGGIAMRVAWGFGPEDCHSFQEQLVKVVLNDQ